MMIKCCASGRGVHATGRGEGHERTGGIHELWSVSEVECFMAGLSRHLVKVTISRQGRAGTPWRRQKPRPPPPPPRTTRDEGRLVGTTALSLAVVAARGAVFLSVPPLACVCVCFVSPELDFLVSRCCNRKAASETERVEGNGV